MTEHETLAPDPYGSYATSTETLRTHATAVAERVRTITDSWLATYGAGDCSPYQIVLALYACHQPLHEAIAVLEQAKQCCRQAMEQPLLALGPRHTHGVICVQNRGRDYGRLACQPPALAPIARHPEHAATYHYNSSS